MKPPLLWLEQAAVSGMYTADYWNDPDIEREKPFWLTNPDDKTLEAYLKRSGLRAEFELVVEHLKAGRLLRGKVLDVAAGVCWTSALLSRYPEVEQVDALEFSWHRLNDIAPVVCASLNADLDKIQPVFGSFYDIARHRPHFYDIVFMSQAFHHAEEPIRLAQECDRALKPGGAIVLLGEHLITWPRFLNRVLRTLLYEHKLTFDFFELFKPDDRAGDHYYKIDHYHFLLRSLGYKVEHHTTNIRDSLMIIATKDVRSQTLGGQ